MSAPRAPTRPARLARAACLAALALCAQGCATFAIQTPADFARVEDPRGYEWRAVAAYGAAIAVRTAPNASGASLGFWVEAVDRTLRRQGSYQPAGMADVRTDAGLAGRRLEYVYGNPRNGSPYWVVLFVTPQRVYILEAGGPAEAFARARPAVEAAIRTFTPR